MRIIDESSNAGRQIVPEDMNYLSMADQEIVSAVEMLMKQMTGTDPDAAIVVSGCEVEFTMTVGRSLFKVSSGVVLWRGLLWELDGISIEGNVRTPLIYNSQLSILFERNTVVSPSPVYGMTLMLNETPHKNTTARIVNTSLLPANAESVTLEKLVRMPLVGLSRGVNSLYIQGDANVTE